MVTKNMEICDRCKKEFELPSDTTKKNNIKFYHEGKTPKGNIEINLKCWYLCNECAGYLQEWLENKICF